MKTTTRLGLLFIALAVMAQAEETPAAPNPAPPASAATPREQLAATLPKYEPPPPPAPKPAEAKPADAVADPEVLELPKMTVKQKPRPRLNADIVYNRADLGDKLAKEKFTQLDRVLNSFTLPLFGAGMAERALEEHEREKKQQLNLDVLNLSKALEQADPAEAKALKEAAAKP